MKKQFLFIFSLILASLSAQTAQAEVNIVSSIRPIYYLVEGVNQGINPQNLLVNGKISPHDYQPKPSDIQKIKAANIIFRIDQDFQPRFNKIFSANASQTNIIELAKLSGIQLPATEQHLNQSHNKNAKHSHSHASFDLHIWLAPNNAIIITQKIALELAKIDPINREKYQYNAQIQVEHLRKLDQALHQTLSPLKEKHFFSYHDAYGNFTGSFGLNHSISLTPSSHQISANRMRAIIKQAKAQNIRCIMLEPQLNDKLAKVLTQAKPDMRTETWDPLGFELDLNANSYYIMINSMADNLLKCLS